MLLWRLPILMLGVCAAAPGAESPPNALTITVEHLPPIVYYREPIALRMRVSNPGTEPAQRAIRTTLELTSSHVRSPKPLSLLIPAAGTAPISIDLPSSGWSSGTVVLVNDANERTILRMRRFDEDAEVPALEARGERLYMPDGAAAVLTVRQRTSQPDREWYFWKRFAQRLGEGTLPAGVILLGNGLCEPGRDPSYFKTVSSRAGTWVEATRLPGVTQEGPVYPIVGDLAVALRALGKARRAELVIWLVSCDDARRSTPIRLLKKSIDLVLHKARLRGASRLAVMFVPEPAVAPERRAKLAEQYRVAASAYRGAFTRLDTLAQTQYWLSTAASAGHALMRYPNAKGQDALAAAILALIQQ